MKKDHIYIQAPEYGGWEKEGNKYYVPFIISREELPINPPQGWQDIEVLPWQSAEVEDEGTDHINLHWVVASILGDRWEQYIPHWYPVTE